MFLMDSFITLSLVWLAKMDFLWYDEYDLSKNIKYFILCKSYLVDYTVAFFYFFEPQIAESMQIEILLWRSFNCILGKW